MAGVGVGKLPDPNQKVYDQYGGKAKYLAAKKARDDAKKAAAKSEKPYLESNAKLEFELNAPATTYPFVSPGGLYAQLKAAQQANNTALVTSLKYKIQTVQGKIHDNNNKIYQYELKIKKAQEAFDKANVTRNPPDNGGGGKNNGANSQPAKKTWWFNAPLVSPARFAPSSSLPKMISAGPAISGDAATFWKTDESFVYTGAGNPLEQATWSTGGKGTFQMDRLTNTVELKATAQKAAKAKNLPFEDKFYGFKFHYNPTTVNMTWSGVMGANPVFEAAGLDPAVPMDSSLLTGTVSFDIILNRIQDFALLNSDGTYKYGANPYGEVTVDKEDLKMIVQKGTMYDMEYFFKTMFGYAFYTSFTSNLMGKTNDPGWLPVRPVELHLGNKLRYRVRVSGLEVVHKIFSENMVPLLSVVTITCMRYWDGTYDSNSLGAVK